MLFYKAWRESRGRFLFAAAAILAACLLFLFRARVAFPLAQNPHVPYSAVVWGTFYGNTAPVVFSMIALVLSLGGLRRESAAGSAGFTLALPLGRVRMLGVRAVVGLAELAALALIPVLMIPLLSPVIARQSYPVVQSIRFSILFMSWGAVWFGIGFVWSVLFAGEFTAVAVSLLTPVAYIVVYARVSGDGRRFPAANPFAFMSGLEHFTNGTSTLTGPLPWIEIGVLVAAASILLAVATWISARQSF